MDRGNRYEGLARQVGAVGAVKRGLARTLPADCPSGSAIVLALLNHHGDVRMGRVAELMAVDMSVSSRHVAHAVDRGWVERLPDPADKRSRILRLTPAGADMLAVLDRRLTASLARHLADWSDEDVELLTILLARLRDSFGDCRAHHA
ncbi:MarR family winged helix-turn-helix transcriptional regulator [Streptomyces sp. NPDC059534]|uniref:MarR family winged helix-turn-helix transcriptional regulator n=1 Tax=Streptomyces sp. NPDC059534 TaxID=3346859 RepID=UPI00367977FD